MSRPAEVAPVLLAIVIGAVAWSILVLALFAPLLPPVTAALWVTPCLVGTVAIWAAQSLQRHGSWSAFVLCGALLLVFATYMFAVIGPWPTRLDQVGSAIGFIVSLAGYTVSWAALYQAAQHRSGECLTPRLVHHVDSLYFSLTTLSTTGYGDIHATSPTCRWLVSGQMAGDVLLVGFAVAGLVNSFVNRPAGTALRRNRPRRASAK